MFPTQSKANRLGRLWLLPVVALALLLVAYAVFASSNAKAQTVAGEYCIEGIVINWEEKPLAGWTISLTSDITIPGALTGNVTTTVSAPKPDEDDKDPDLLKGEFEFQDLLGAPGIYTATIESRPGWEGVTPTSFTFPIEVGRDDCVRIRFKMARIIPVTVRKIDANHTPLNDWKIKAVPGPGNLFASPEVEETGPVTLTGGTVVTGAATFSLTPGVWIFTEHPPKQDRDEPRETYMPVVPPTGRQELRIDEDDDEITVVFKNELVTGCVAVRKIASTGATGNGNGNGDPLLAGYDVGGWGFELRRMDGSVARRGVTGANGILRFDNLPLGPYILVEEDRPGWNEISERELEINVTGNNCATPIEFTNEQDDSGFCIEGRKIDANGGYGLPGWEIEIEPLAKGGFEPDNVFTDGLGNFTVNFPRNDYRIPGAEYEVCEVEQDGWLPHTPSCQIVRLPEWPGACVQLKDFVNQQVGHSESQKHDKGHKQHGHDGYDKGYDKGHGHGKDISCSTYHVVKAGEGLYDIGKMYHKSAQQMLDANPAVKNHPHQWVIQGQRICIP